ncbi:MAG TPA: Gfo/Idh/MocA family oxidoreductase [Terriglobales bacterium]|nr:Gfo/Idh/MocA family oxidoreductase [Terriglobales bacterium]
MHKFSRRDFLQTTAAAAGAAVAGHTILLEPERAWTAPSPAPSDRVRFGIIGVGMQGSPLLTNAIKLEGVECAAACDVYDGRHTLAREIAGPNVPTTRRYQELLENREIDCVIVAVPDHWHKRIVVDAVSAGKDVYCEKPMSHSLSDGNEMVAAAQKSNRIVQVGSQRTSSAILGKARELYSQGAIGDLLQVELSLGRNDPTGAWEYPPPPDLSPANLDWETWLGPAPRKPFDPYTFARWRCWKEYGTGVAGDLMVHLVSGVQFITGINQAPDNAFAYGGIVRWKDGRNMPDLHTVLFEYGRMPVYVRLTLGTETPEMTRIMGSKGLLEITDRTLTYTPQPGVDLEPSYYSQGFPHQMREEYIRQWHEEHKSQPGHERLAEVTTYRGPSYNDLQPHLWNFFEAVRTRKPVLQDAVFGHHAAAACHLANQAYFRSIGEKS